MPTDKEVEDKAEQIYLDHYGHIGGLWRLVDTKDVWRKMAREQLEGDEGTRMVPPSLGMR